MSGVDFCSVSWGSEDDMSEPAMERGRSDSSGDLAGDGSRTLGVLMEATGSGDVGSIWFSVADTSTFSMSTVLGVLSVSFVIVISESAIDPAYSETDAMEGEIEVIDRVPESSRTRNCEIEGLRAGEGEVERFGADSPRSGLEGRPCWARIS